ncbi:acetylornithine transaminase [Cavenderia fasciculata]|uniref:acetylornithine transaminase n=1 Tax=Cavenderia fasciculata TaxID=261658 RepID=F4PIU9_CACFS|nr:acetylornithine transaminase [Cavenderia fasciculata]EGG24235.1 acetylornithine transaminase [Cavenderia fasciculata]|eukprot:XP_004362086.1 acetylornithine transaminase [Cavenderia fasciculata]
MTADARRATLVSLCHFPSSPNQSINRYASQSSVDEAPQLLFDKIPATTAVIVDDCLYVMVSIRTLAKPTTSLTYSTSSSLVKKPELLDINIHGSKDTAKIIDLHNKVIMNTYARVPNLVMDHGKNAHLYDVKGDRYIDFTAGIAVNALGHADEEVLRVMTEQGAKLTHISNVYFNAPAIELAQKLIAYSSFDKCFFANSGTEANEGALKFARRHGLSKNPNKINVIAFTHGFSGRSMGALSCTHKSKYREIYGPLVPGIAFADYNNIDSVRELISDNTCAVLIEPVQGEGGLEAARPDFMQDLEKLCREHDALLIVDEVQCGVGRTGRLWAHERLGVQPDIMTLAKPLANGLPIGAILVREHVAQVIGQGDHGTTYGGGPLVCAVANNVFGRIANEDFLREVRVKGARIVTRLTQISKSSHGQPIIDIRTTGGLFVGVEFDHPVKELIAFANTHHKVLFISAGDNTIRLCPSLTVPQEDIDIAIDAIEAYLKSKEKSNHNKSIDYIIYFE